MGNSFKSFSVINFTFGFLKNILVGFIGTIPLNEIFAGIILLLPRNLKRLPSYFSVLRIPLVLLLVLLLSQVTSDIINQNTLHNMARGWVNIIISAAMIIFVYHAIWLQPNKIFSIFIGYSISLLLFVWFSPKLAVFENGLSRLLFAPLLGYIFICTSYFFYERIKLHIWYLSIITGVVSLSIFDARSAGLIFIASGFIYKMNSLFKPIKSKQFLTPIIVAFAILCILWTGFIYVSENNNTFSRSKTQFAKIDNPYHPLQLIKITRPQVYVSALSIAKKPLLGYGSWPKDKTGEYYDEFVDINKISPKLTKKLKKQEIKTIPSHSVLLGAWLNAGIIGFLAMLVLLICLIQKLIKKLIANNIQKQSQFNFLIIFFIVSLPWIFLFEPIQRLRFEVAIIIAFTLLPSRVSKHSNAISKL